MAAVLCVSFEMPKWTSRSETLCGFASGSEQVRGTIKAKAVSQSVYLKYTHAACHPCLLSSPSRLYPSIDRFKPGTRTAIDWWVLPSGRLIDHVSLGRTGSQSLYVLRHRVNLFLLRCTLFFFFHRKLWINVLFWIRYSHPRLQISGRNMLS